MSAQPNTPHPSREVSFEPLPGEQMEAVIRIEQQSYAHPWSRANFVDALQAGNQAQMLVAGGEIVGYFVAMKGVGEVHLLNITVAPAYQGQGWAKVMLEALAVWSRGQQAGTLWLEVRQSNTRALRVYEAFGFCHVGVRKDYYPAAHGQREHALVMRLGL